MYHKKSEKGQALILIVLAIVGLIGLTALAVDGGMAYSERRQAQNTADASALDAALAKVRGGAWQAEGLARANSNGFDNNGTTNTVVVNNPPVAGCNGTNSAYAGDSQYVQVIIRASTQTFFGPVVGITEVNNCVEAIARAKPPVLSQMFNGNAIVGLSPHDCKAIMYQGNAATTVTGGGIYTNSDCEDSAFFNNSSSAKLTAPCLQAVGGINYNPSAINIPAECIKPGASVLPPITYPDPQCTSDTAQDGNTLSAGNWPPAGHKGSTKFPPAGVDHLNSGVYCVNQGDFDVNGGSTLIGSNVVIVVNSGNVSWNGGANIQLDAPDDGPFAGLLLFMPETNHGTVSINGNSTSTFTGSILVPSADVTINGTGAPTGLSCQIVGYTVDISGNSAMSIHYNAGSQYQAPVPPQIELIR